MATTSFVDNSTLIQASWLNDADTATYSGLTSIAGTNTITATGPASMTAYASAQTFRFIPAATNTGATTIAITPSGGAALAAKNIFSGGAACVGGEIVSGVPCTVIYDGTQFNIVGSILKAGVLDISAGTLGQIKFPATQNASTNANTLDDYEEGTWTPTDASGAALSLTITDATYIKTGKGINAKAAITYPVTADGSAAVVGGLPYTSAAVTALAGGSAIHARTTSAVDGAYIGNSATTATWAANGTAATVTNATLSGKLFYITYIYTAAS